MKKPWEFDHRLSEDRLMIVAKALIEGRETTCDTLDIDDLDEMWSLGCTAFARSKNAVIRIAEGPTAPWLKIISPKLDFVFCIDGVLCRFLRDDPDDPSARILRIAANEPLLPFMAEVDASPTLWRFVIESDVDGRTSRMAMLGLNGAGVVLAKWEMGPSAAIVEDGDVARKDSWSNTQNSDADKVVKAKPRKRRDEETR